MILSVGWIYLKYTVGGGFGWVSGLETPLYLKGIFVYTVNKGMQVLAFPVLSASLEHCSKQADRLAPLHCGHGS